MSLDGLFREGVHTFRLLWIDRVSAGVQWCDLRRGTSYVTAHMQTIKAQSCFQGAAYSLSRHISELEQTPGPSTSLWKCLCRSTHCVCLPLCVSVCVCVCVSVKQLTFIHVRWRNMDMHRVNSVKVLFFFRESSHTGGETVTWLVDFSLKEFHSIFFTPFPGRLSVFSQQWQQWPGDILQRSFNHNKSSRSILLNVTFYSHIN